MLGIKRIFSVPRISKRNLWCSASSINPDLSEAVEQCRDKLSGLISPFLQSDSSINEEQLNETYLFALISNSYNASEIDSFSSKISNSISTLFTSTKALQELSLTNNSSSKNKNINISNVYGTVVDGVLNSNGEISSTGISLLFYNRHLKHTDLDSSSASGVSFSQFDHLDGLFPVPFSVSPYSNRSKLNTNSVGKSYRSNDIMPAMNSEKNIPHIESISKKEFNEFDFFKSVSQAEFNMVLPKELDQLHHDKYGLIGSQTPFINGRDFSLIYKNALKSNGIYGVAFYSNLEETKSSKYAGNVLLEYPSYVPIGNPAKVTRSRGNMILDIDGNAAVYWLKSGIEEAIKQTNSKDIKYEPCALFISDPESLNSNVALQITGGDPSRGGISIDTTNEIVSNGQYIQMLYPVPNATNLATPEIKN
ncbi:hypothetical protein AYI68_g6574, partial [Smittium mucronatum]